MTSFLSLVSCGYTRAEVHFERLTAEFFFLPDSNRCMWTGHSDSSEILYPTRTDACGQDTVTAVKFCTWLEQMHVDRTQWHCVPDSNRCMWTGHSDSSEIVYLTQTDACGQDTVTAVRLCTWLKHMHVDRTQWQQWNCVPDSNRCMWTGHSDSSEIVYLTRTDACGQDTLKAVALLFWATSCIASSNPKRPSWWQTKQICSAQQTSHVWQGTRPHSSESPMVTMTWYASKYKVLKLHKRYTIITHIYQPINFSSMHELNLLHNLPP